MNNFLDLSVKHSDYPGFINVQLLRFANGLYVSRLHKLSCNLSTIKKRLMRTARERVSWPTWLVVVNSYNNNREKFPDMTCTQIIIYLRRPLHVSMLNQ